MIPQVGMRVRLNTPNDEDYMGAKNGDIGTLTEPVYASRRRWYVRWDKYPSHYYNYSIKELQFNEKFVGQENG